MLERKLDTPECIKRKLQVKPIEGIYRDSSVEVWKRVSNGLPIIVVPDAIVNTGRVWTVVLPNGKKIKAFVAGALDSIGISGELIDEFPMGEEIGFEINAGERKLSFEQKKETGIAERLDDIKYRLLVASGYYVQAGDIIDEKTEKKGIARHEAAHALLHIFAENNITKAEVHILRERTCARINILLSPLVYLIPGQVYVYDRSTRESPGKSAIIHVAGFANTKDDEGYRGYFDKELPKHVSNGAKDESADISYPCKYIIGRFLVLQNRTPTNEEVSTVYYALLDRVYEIFQEEKFARALEKIADLIMGRKLKKNINAKIKSELEAIGISEEDLAEMNRRIYSINIDDLIETGSQLVSD